MAKNYLAIQATSVSCEQTFPIAGLTISKVQNRLNSETTRALLCLKLKAGFLKKFVKIIRSLRTINPIVMMILIKMK